MGKKSSSFTGVFFKGDMVIVIGGFESQVRGLMVEILSVEDEKRQSVSFWDLTFQNSDTADEILTAHFRNKNLKKAQSDDRAKLKRSITLKTVESIIPQEALVMC